MGGGSWIEWPGRQRAAIAHRREAYARGAGDASSLLGRQYLLHGHRLHAIDVVGSGLQPELRHEGGGRFVGGIAWQSRERGAALHDGAVKEAMRRRHRHQGTDLTAPAGLAEDGDVTRIAAEGCDVL